MRRLPLSKLAKSTDRSWASWNFGATSFRPTGLSKYGYRSGQVDAFKNIKQSDFLLCVNYWIVGRLPMEITNSRFVPTTGIERPRAKIMARTTVVEKPARGWPLGRCLQALWASVLLLTSAGAVLAQATWPQVATPKGITTIDLGEQVTANGLPIRMRGFTSVATPAQVAELFRKSLGQPLVEDTVGANLVLGRSRGEHYVTVQLEAAGTGSRGLIAVTEMTAALNGQTTSHNADQQLLARLPAGFSIVNRTASADSRNRVEHVVLTNTHSIALNTESIKSMLGAEGFTFERETQSTGQSNARRGASSRNGITLFFRRSGDEAIAVISRDDSGTTGVVLNITGYLERAK